MADKNAEQIKALYTELAKISASQDWERILKVSKKILGLSVTEKKAFHCKVVCLIHLDKFDEALSSIERNPDASDLYFERAYCEYRLNKINEAYETLLKCKEMTTKEKELLAQVTYRLEKYKESYEAYRDIIKNIDDDFDAERQTNLSAVVSSWKAASKDSKDLDMTENEKKTYELCYNSACISLSKKNYKEAEEKLKRAELMCKKTFEDEEDQEILENEIAIIRVQLAFCLQKLGKEDESLKIYNNVIKNKPSDLAVMAVASNNLVCVNKDQNVFDSKKRLKAATASELDLKLNSMQRRLIAYNEILFSIITNQKDAVQRLLQQFKEKFSDNERYSLLKMSQLYKDKKYADAEKVLLEVINNGQSSSFTRYYLIQILLLQGKATDAIEQFKQLDEFKVFKLGIVSAIVSIYNHKNEKDKINSLLTSAIDYFNSTNNHNAKEMGIYIRESSNYQIATGNLQKASELLEKMRSLRPDDFKILSKLINIYSKFDAVKAKKLSEELPSLEEVLANSNIDIDSLETQFSLMNAKYSKLKSAIGTGQVKSPDSKAASTGNKADAKLKKKKKRKVKLPKNYDPNVPLDAERWLPLRERSYYRGRRNKKKQNAVGKGTQGAVSAKDAAALQQSPKPGAVNTPEPVAEKPKPKAPSSSHQKKKKKGGKW